jgi:hypothetical protein
MMALAVIVAIAGCDLSTTRGDIASISTLELPAPSVVIGDVLRDSLGTPTPLSIEVFDATGTPIANAPVVFTAPDTTIAVDASGVVHGLFRDTIGARVIAGAGGLQTPVSHLFVSVPPTVAAKTTTTTTPTIVFDTHALDTLAQSNWSPLLGVTMTDASKVGAQGFIVRYSIVRSPTPLKAGVPTAYIGNDIGAATARDTTDRTGAAARRVVLRQAAIGDIDLLSGTKTDTIIVRATASYGGQAIPGTPLDFFIPVSKKP